MSVLEPRKEFTTRTKRAAYVQSGGHCMCGCGHKFKDWREPQYDHIIPTSIRRDNSLQNCMVLTVACHATVTAKDRREIDKTRRIIKKRVAPKAKRAWANRPMAGTKKSGWKRPMNGKAHRR